MKKNRSMPRNTVIPVISYPDIEKAIDWLTKTFDFSVRVLIGDHRAQLNVGNECVVIRKSEKQGGDYTCHSIMIRVDHVDHHYHRTKDNGATIISEPTSHVFGERQYSVKDFKGHIWTFSETVEDTLPEEWGGRSIELL